MNFQQLRIVKEAIRQNLKLSEVGKTLCTSLSDISKGLKELEDELRVELFSRSGKRLIGLTNVGENLIGVVERILQDTQNIRRMAGEFSNQTNGRLVLATTHTQARYALPPKLRSFILDYPGIHLTLHQGSPREIAELLLEGEADIGIATAGLAGIPTLGT